MKIKISIFLILICSILNIKGQIIPLCLNNPIDTTTLLIERVRMLASGTANCSFNDIWANETTNDPYIPNSNSSIYTIKLNLHIMQETNGSANFQDNTTDKGFIQQLISDVNAIYSTNQQPTWNGLRSDPYINDSKIRFQIDGVYFHQNSSVCHLKPYNENTNSDTYFQQYGVNIGHSINVFFSELLRDNGTPYTPLAGNGFGLNGEERNCLGM